MKNNLLPLLVLIISSSVLGGCGGGTSSVQASTTTIGQELMDLQKSRDQGIVTEKEYERAKKDILKRYN